MPLEAAVEQLENVGHDFFLFLDAADGATKVLYRRRWARIPPTGGGTRAGAAWAGGAGSWWGRLPGGAPGAAACQARGRRRLWCLRDPEALTHCPSLRALQEPRLWRAHCGVRCVTQAPRSLLQPRVQARETKLTNCTPAVAGGPCLHPGPAHWQDSTAHISSELHRLPLLVMTSSMAQFSLPLFGAGSFFVGLDAWRPPSTSAVSICHPAASHSACKTYICAPVASFLTDQCLPCVRNGKTEGAGGAER